MSDFNIRKFLKENTGLTKAQEIAQDMVDAGFAATSDAHFEDMFSQYAKQAFGGARYFQGSDQELQQLLNDTRDAYKLILRNKARSGSDFNAINEDPDTRSDAERKASGKKKRPHGYLS